MACPTELAMKPDSYYWFYGVVGQVTGAIAATLGVFLVYALQQIRDIINLKIINLVALGQALGHNLNGYPIEEVLTRSLNKIESHRSHGTFGDREQQVEREASRIRHYLTQQEIIKNQFKRTFFFLLGLLVASLLMLPFAHYADISKSYWKAIFTIVLLGFIVSIVAVGHFVSSVFSALTK